MKSLTNGRQARRLNSDYFTAANAKLLAVSSASPIFEGSFPPACAICGRPPPPPPATLAVSRIQSPALRSFGDQIIGNGGDET